MSKLETPHKLHIKLFLLWYVHDLNGILGYHISTVETVDVDDDKYKRKSPLAMIVKWGR